MVNARKLYEDLLGEVKSDEDIEAISYYVHQILDQHLSISPADVASMKELSFSSFTKAYFSNILMRIRNNEPLQYILGNAVFYGRQFKVTKNVLIPRRQTEGLIDVVKDIVSNNRLLAPAILDIGTGSGCVSATLKLEIPVATIVATDVSLDALAVARVNFNLHRIDVELQHHDILHHDLPEEKFDVVISNPPYITREECLRIDGHINTFEPHLALFAPDEDPLKFCKIIAKKAYQSLVIDGALILEINREYATQVVALLNEAGFENIEVMRDVWGFDRIVKGIKRVLNNANATIRADKK